MRPQIASPPQSSAGDSTSVVGEVIRPEARRAYVDGTSTSSSSSKIKSLDRSSRNTDTRTEFVKKDDSTDKILLQQAAAYAPLASMTGAETRRSSGGLRRARNSGMTSPDGTSSSFDGETGLSLNHHAGLLTDVVGGDTIPNHSSKLRPSRFFRLSRSRDQVPSVSSSSHLYPRAFRKDVRDDVEGHDAPRLSISSTEESSNGSEIKTPESFTDSMGWSRTSVVAPDSTEHQKNEMKQMNDVYNLSRLNDMAIPNQALRSPPLIDLSTGFDEAGLTGAAKSVKEEEVDPALVEAALKLESYSSDNVQDTLQDYNEESLSPHEQKRGSTIRAKRPDTLLRLPSARTDDTARPSPPSTSVSSAGPTPAATSDNAFGKSRDPMEDAVFSLTSEQKLSSAFEEPPLSPTARDGIPPSFESNRVKSRCSTAEGTSLEARAQSSDSRSEVASPDSWRSLLPEHDPYFISNEALTYRSSSRTQSLSGIAGMDGTASSMLHSSSEGQGNTGVLLSQALASTFGDRDGRRLSTESMQSSFSHSNQPLGASIYASSNTSGSLYDMDGTFNSSGSRAAFAPLSYQYNQSTKSLASPSLQSATNTGPFATNTEEPLQMRTRPEGSEKGQSSSTDSRSLALQSAAARRHASFSAIGSTSFDMPTSPTFHQPFIHPDHHNWSRVMGNETVRQRPVVSDTSPERRQGVPLAQPTRLGSLQSRSKVSPSSPICQAMGNEGERETWPTSRRISAKK